MVKDKPKYQLKMGIDLDPEKATKVIIELSNINVKETSNVLQGLNYGSYSSRATVFDIGNQEVKDFDFNAYELYNDIPKLNDGKIQNLMQI